MRDDDKDHKDDQENDNENDDYDYNNTYDDHHMEKGDDRGRFSRLAADDKFRLSYLDTQHRTNDIRTFFNITKCFIGAASFELPWAIRQAGLIGGAVGILALGLMSFYTLTILTICGHFTAQLSLRKIEEEEKEKEFDIEQTNQDGNNNGVHASITTTTHFIQNSRPTYPQIGKHAFGVIGSFLAWLGVIAMTVGVCGSYVLFIGSSINKLLFSYHPIFTLEFSTVLVVPIIIAMSWLRNLKFLAPTSALGCKSDSASNSCCLDLIFHNRY